MIILDMLNYLPGPSVLLYICLAILEGSSIPNPSSWGHHPRLLRGPRLEPQTEMLTSYLLVHLAARLLTVRVHVSGPGSILEGFSTDRSTQLGLLVTASAADCKKSKHVCVCSVSYTHLTLPTKLEV